MAAGSYRKLLSNFLPCSSANQRQLSGAAPLNRLGFRRCNRQRRPRIGIVEADQNLVCRVLQAGIRLVKLPSSLAGQLTQLVTIRQVRKCSKNKIRTHYSLSYIFAARLKLPGYAGAAGIQSVQRLPK